MVRTGVSLGDEVETGSAVLLSAVCVVLTIEANILLRYYISLKDRVTYHSDY